MEGTICNENLRIIKLSPWDVGILLLGIRKNKNECKIGGMQIEKLVWEGGVGCFRHLT